MSRQHAYPARSSAVLIEASMSLTRISAGGTKGIGKACVEELAALGAKVHTILMAHGVKTLPNNNTSRLCNSLWMSNY